MTIEQKNLVLADSENKLISHCFLSKDNYTTCNLWLETEKSAEKKISIDLKKKHKSVAGLPVFTKINVDFKSGKENPPSKSNSKMCSKKFERVKSLKNDNDFYDEIGNENGNENEKLKNFLFDINKNEYDEINFAEFLNVLTLSFCGINLNKSLKFESKNKTLESQNNSVISAETTIKYSKEIPVKNTFNASNIFKNSIDFSLDNSAKIMEKNEIGEENNNELTYFDILIKK